MPPQHSFSLPSHFTLPSNFHSFNFYYSLSFPHFSSLIAQSLHQLPLTPPPFFSHSHELFNLQPQPSTWIPATTFHSATLIAKISNHNRLSVFIPSIHFIQFTFTQSLPSFIRSTHPQPAFHYSLSFPHPAHKRTHTCQPACLSPPACLSASCLALSMPRLASPPSRPNEPLVKLGRRHAGFAVVMRASLC